MSWSSSVGSIWTKTLWMWCWCFTPIPWCLYTLLIHFYLTSHSARVNYCDQSPSGIFTHYLNGIKGHLTVNKTKENNRVSYSITIELGAKNKKKIKDMAPYSILSHIRLHFFKPHLLHHMANCKQTLQKWSLCELLSLLFKKFKFHSKLVATATNMKISLSGTIRPRA